ncbi:lipoprotein [Sorangium cellulosum]|jgi:rare lipoprotein A|uniref:Probable endolytic peptidoglycan transglycosylase RlpA n=1 Tax=Sorangium cellulosum TaxID=56 RepID=A0A4P2Q0Y3_SORCE|nr:septal ring lytic transglycosylase RlpA family protein [Sorangium cellulosum]AUX22875.1 lipoprotein [Sorangium cellulosum]
MTALERRHGAARALALILLCISSCSAHQPVAPRTGDDAAHVPAPARLVPESSPAPPERGDDEADEDERRISTPIAPASARRATKGVPIQRGRATYYADKFTGRATASGEPYNPRAMTAAHRTLPFGTLVDVVRRDGRRVRVRINDRGPFKRGRVIDLSRKAAERLGLIKEGVVDVTLELIWKPARKPSKKRPR